MALPLLLLQLLTYGRRIPFAELFARIDAVDASTIKRVANRFIFDQVRKDSSHCLLQIIELQRKNITPSPLNVNLLFHFGMSRNICSLCKINGQNCSHLNFKLAFRCLICNHCLLNSWVSKWDQY